MTIGVKADDASGTSGPQSANGGGLFVAYDKDLNTKLFPDATLYSIDEDNPTDATLIAHDDVDVPAGVDVSVAVQYNMEGPYPLEGMNPFTTSNTMSGDLFGHDHILVEQGLAPHSGFQEGFKMNVHQSGTSLTVSRTLSRIDAPPDFPFTSAGGFLNLPTYHRDGIFVCETSNSSNNPPILLGMTAFNADADYQRAADFKETYGPTIPIDFINAQIGFPPQVYAFRDSYYGLYAKGGNASAIALYQVEPSTLTITDYNNPLPGLTGPPESFADFATVNSANLGAALTDTKMIVNTQDPTGYGFAIVTRSGNTISKGPNAVWGFAFPNGFFTTEPIRLDDTHFMFWVEGGSFGSSMIPIIPNYPTSVAALVFAEVSGDTITYIAASAVEDPLEVFGFSNVIIGVLDSTHLLAVGKVGGLPLTVVTTPVPWRFQIIPYTATSGVTGPSVEVEIQNLPAMGVGSLTLKFGARGQESGDFLITYRRSSLDPFDFMQGCHWNGTTIEFGIPVPLPDYIENHPDDFAVGATEVIQNKLVAIAANYRIGEFFQPARSFGLLIYDDLATLADPTFRPFTDMNSDRAWRESKDWSAPWFETDGEFVYVRQNSDVQVRKYAITAGNAIDVIPFPLPSTAAGANGDAWGFAPDGQNIYYSSIHNVVHYGPLGTNLPIWLDFRGLPDTDIRSVTNINLLRVDKTTGHVFLFWDPFDNQLPIIIEEYLPDGTYVDRWIPRTAFAPAPHLGTGWETWPGATLWPGTQGDAIAGAMTVRNGMLYVNFDLNWGFTTPGTEVANAVWRIDTNPGANRAGESELFVRAHQPAGEQLADAEFSPITSLSIGGGFQGTTTGSANDPRVGIKNAPIPVRAS